MTNPLELPNPILNRTALTLVRPKQYFEHFPYQDQNLARAGDVNLMQDHIEQGFQRFGDETAFVIDNLILAMIGFSGLVQKRQDLFEAATNATIAALRAELLAQEAGFEARVLADIADFKALMLQKLAELKTYTDQQDAYYLKQAAAYTDTRFNELAKLLLDSTRFGVNFSTGDMHDQNLFGGTDFPFVITVVPTGHTLEVHRWTYTHNGALGFFSSFDQLKTSWPNFLGYVEFTGSEVSFATRNSGTYSQNAIIRIAGPAEVKAVVTVNNYTAQATFGIEGFLIPDSYAGLGAATSAAGTVAAQSITPGSGGTGGGGGTPPVVTNPRPDNL